MRHLLPILLIACSSKEPASEAKEQAKPEQQVKPEPPKPKNRLAKVTAKDPYTIENVAFLPAGTNSFGYCQPTCTQSEQPDQSGTCILPAPE